MTALTAAPTRTRRAALASLPLLLLGLLAPLVVAPPASAATIGTLATGFQIDGDKEATGATPPNSFDWNNFITGVQSNGTYTFTPTGPYTTTQGNSSTGVIDANFAWDNGSEAASCVGADASAFPGSVKPASNPWTPGAANVNTKSDGCSSGSAYEVVTAGGIEHHILYLYWTRLSGNGDMSLYSVLEGGQPGRCGDVLVEFNYNSPSGNSGSSSAVYILNWVPKNGDCSAGAAGGWVPTTATSVPHVATVGVRTEGPNQNGEPETFGEIAVDLTAGGLFQSGACTAFVESGYVTRTGNSAESELIDYVGPGSNPLEISNCGSITVSKKASPADATGATAFGYVVNRTSPGVAHAASLAGSNGQAAVLDQDQSNQSLTQSLILNTKHTWTGVFAGTYSLTETIPGGAPWTLASMVCTVKNPSTGQTQTIDVPTGATLAGIPVYTGTTTDCVITNATSYLTVTKKTVGAEGEQFGFDVTGDTVADVTLAGSTAGTVSTTLQYRPGTPVTVTELLAAVNGAQSDDLDWKLTDIGCSVSATETSTSATVTTVAGSTVDCTFTNSQYGSIIVNKVVEGVTSTVSFPFEGDWTSGTPAIVNGKFTIQTAEDQGAITGSRAFLNVEPGTYSLSELAQAGFDTKNLVCIETGTQDTVVVDLEATIKLGAGETVSCTFTNTERGQIIVNKETVPDGYDQSFSFVFTPPQGDQVNFSQNDKTDDPWASGLLQPGTYTVAETVPDNWTLTGVTGCGTVTQGSATIQLAAGAVVTCTFTNTADTGSVTLSKSVRGVADGFAWSFTVILDGPGEPVEQTVTNGDPSVTWDDLRVGATYTLIEGTLPDGWTAGPVECEGITDDDAQAEGLQFTVTPGLSLSCSLTNTVEEPGTLSLVKTTTGAADGYDWEFGFTVSPAPGEGAATQTATETDATLEWGGLTPGTVYTVTEEDVVGWNEGAVTCSVGGSALLDESADAGFQFAAAIGTEVSCTVENRAVPGSITIEKTAIGGDGSFEFALQPLDELGEPEGEALSDTAETDGGTGTAAFTSIEPGSRFALSEVDPGSDWIMGDLTCDVDPAGPTGASPIDVDDFVVNPGDVITCDITNTKTGTIVVVKNVEGADAEFDYTFTPDGDPAQRFSLTTVNGTDTTSFDDLEPGAYTLVELLGAGYDGTNLECSDKANSTVSLETLTADLALDAGETITCTYTNTEWGTLIVDKVTIPGDSEQEFDFEWAPVGGTAEPFSLTDDADPFSTGPMEPGEYFVEEFELAGWVLTALVCTDEQDQEVGTVADGKITVDVGLQETITCVFENSERGPVTFDKTVAGSPVDNGNGTWTVKYTLKATSTSQVEETYDLDDELQFGDGITVVSAEATSPDTTANAGWDGDTDTVVVDDEPIDPLDTHTFTVTVVYDLPAVLTPRAADCTFDDGEEGTGLYNGGTLTWDGERDADDACVVVPITDIQIQKDGPFGIDIDTSGPATPLEYTIVITNNGPTTAKDVTLEDELPEGVDYLSATTTEDALCAYDAGTHTLSCVFDDDLAVNDSYTVTVTMSVPPNYPLTPNTNSYPPIVNVAATATSTPESTLDNNDDDATTFALPTLSLPDPPEIPDLPTLALTGASLAGLQGALGLLVTGIGLIAWRARRPQGKHAA